MELKQISFKYEGILTSYFDRKIYLLNSILKEKYSNIIPLAYEQNNNVVVSGKVAIASNLYDIVISAIGTMVISSAEPKNPSLVSVGISSLSDAIENVFAVDDSVMKIINLGKQKPLIKVRKP